MSELKKEIGEMIYQISGSCFAFWSIVYGEIILATIILVIGLIVTWGRVVKAWFDKEPLESGEKDLKGGFGITTISQ